MLDDSHIHVRPMEMGDFEFIRGLASQQPNFTVPSFYMLWLFMRIKGSICLVAEHNAKGTLAYLLAVPIEGVGKSIFIWQLSVTELKEPNAGIVAILQEFHKRILALGVDRLLFSTIVDSPIYRLIRRYAWDLARLVPQKLNPLPPAIGGDESEFLLRLDPSHRGSQ